MKNIRRTAVHGLLFSLIMVVVASTGMEAQAQRGRAESGRKSNSTSVERRGKSAKSTASEERGKAAQRKAVKRRGTSEKGVASESRPKATSRKVVNRRDGNVRKDNDNASRRVRSDVQSTSPNRKVVSRRDGGVRTGEDSASRRVRNDVRSTSPNRKVVNRGDGNVRKGNDSAPGRVRGDVGRTSPPRTSGVNRKATARNREGDVGRTSGGRPARGAARVEDANSRHRDTRGAVRDRDSRVKHDDGQGKRSIYTGDRTLRKNRHLPSRNRIQHKHNKKGHGHHYRHDRRHRAKYAWCKEYHPAGHHHYVNAHIHIGSHVHIGVKWPWVKRHHQHWRPRYRYRQVVNVYVGWGGHSRTSLVDVRTYYRHRVLHASDRFAEIEVELDAIELYQDGRYLGTVDRIPGSLSKVRATLHADGRIDFDRDIFIVGDAHAGFEILATRYYNDYLYNAYDSRHGYRVGHIDLRRGKVKQVRHSRLFDPYNFDGFVPISLLPDDDRLWDYGSPYMDGRYRDGIDGSGWYKNYRDREFEYDDDDYELSRDLNVSYRTPQGAEIRMERSTWLDRL